MPAPIMLGLDPVHGPYVTKVRQRFGRLTPFRLGMEEGATGGEFPCPYGARSTAGRLWREGFDVARQNKRNQQENQQ